MHLKRLELYGFKSFAQRTEIDFDRGITAIVGPNGSGKSNVSDAVRWVLGEQSAKSLRGGSMQDIIFGGTEKKKALSACEVTLVFDNSDFALPVEYSEVSVTRRAYRSGENEYFINQKACRLKDIVAMFHDTGVGKEGYSIIGQGRINDILSAKSEDRRLVLEEAAGITKYKTRKLDAERKLQHTAENLSRIHDILEELGSRLEPLRQQSAEARQYLALRERLKVLELNHFLYRQDKDTQRQKSAQESILELGELYEEKQRQEAALSNDETEQAMRELDSKLNLLSQEIVEASTEIERRAGKESLLRERMEHAVREQERIAQAVERSEGQLEEHAASLRDMQQSLSAAQRKDAEADQLVEGRQRAFTQADAEERQAEQELEQRKNEMIAQMNRQSDVKSRLARLEAMKTGQAGQLAELEGQIGNVVREAGKLEQETAEARKQMQTLLQQKDSLGEELAVKTGDLQRIQRETDGKKAELRKQEDALQGARSAYSMLKEMQKYYEGYAYSVKRLLTDCETNASLSGRVEGVVASLIQTPKQYETAIELALGGALQNVVTGSEQDAKQIIEYLRQKKYGRATFMPLSAAKPRHLNEKERAALLLPGVLGVASELVDYDKKYEKVIASLLGRTVIVEDLDAGIGLMKRTGYAFRAVTLKGDILSPGGTMSGGSVHTKNTSLLGRERSIAQAREQIAQLDRSREALLAELARQEVSRQEAALGAEAIQGSLHTLDVDIARETEKLDTVLLYCNKNTQTRQSLCDERDRLAERIADVERELETLRGLDASPNEDGVSREEIVAQTAALVALREQRERCSLALTEAKLALLAQQKETQGLCTDIARVQREMDKLRRERERQQEELRRAEQRKAQYEQEQARLSAGEQAQGHELAALHQRKQQMEQEKEILFETMQQIGGQKRVLQQEMKELLDKKHRMEVLFSRLEAELDNRARRIWEDYELTYAGALPYKQELALGKIQQEIDEIRQQLKEMGDINPRAIEEAVAVEKRYEDLTLQKTDMENARENLNALIDELTVTMRRQFREEFAKIDENFGVVFAQLFGGGSARLLLTDGADVLNSPIEIHAQPPGKKLQAISLLSGGEKSLVALALLFAILSLRPAPFCILDEVDTSLDEVNGDRFAEYVLRYREETQFIIITHKKNSMAVADCMFGVAMEEKGVSRIISVRIADKTA
ncbi:MAG: chromosome segregation protein SMC [Christensenellales bacterium]